MVEKEILKEPNFAGLPGCSTAEAIYLVEMILEEAKENRKKLGSTTRYCYSTGSLL